MIGPEQMELFDEDMYFDAYLLETEEEALASAGFGMSEDYNSCEQDWDNIVYGK